MVSAPKWQVGSSRAIVDKASATRDEAADPSRVLRDHIISFCNTPLWIGSHRTITYDLIETGKWKAYL